MAAVANQVHSTAQQIGGRIGWNPTDAATQPPTGTREHVLNLSDPRTDHRNLGFEDSSLSGAPPFSPAVLGWSLMMAAIGAVLGIPASGWLINKFGSLSIVIVGRHWGLASQCPCLPNPILRGHLKSGQWWSLQNRPTECGLGLGCFTPTPRVEASLFSCANSVDRI